MKQVPVQKLPLALNSSFVARTFRTPHFEVGWHQHPEIELILLSENAGQAFIGNYIGDFAPGDIFLLGSNLPHTFNKASRGRASAMVVQFLEDFWGADLLGLPEMRPLADLFALCLQGLRITGACRQALTPKIAALEHLRGPQRILGLLECLTLIVTSKEWEALSTQEVRQWNQGDMERLEAVFRYTAGHFKEPIPLQKVAALTALSVPAFCQYFKKRTQKTFVTFLNEVRINHACTLLVETEDSVTDICYDCGFNTVTNFHRQFKAFKGITPHQFRSAATQAEMRSI